MPYRIAARAEDDARSPRASGLVLSRATRVAAASLAVIGLVAGLAVHEPVTRPRAVVRRADVPPDPPEPAPAPSPSPAPLVRGGLPPHVRGDYAPAAFGPGGELELAAGRHGARVTSDQLFALAPGARCEVELAADASGCALEVRCGERTLYASSPEGSFFCERGAGGGVTTMLDRGLSLSDGSPVLVQDWSEGYGLELHDYGPSGWGTTRLLLEPSAPPFAAPRLL